MKPSSTKSLVMGIAMGAQFVGSFVGGIGLGWIVDERFATDPIGVFVGVSVGLTVGIFLLVRSEDKRTKDDK